VPARYPLSSTGLSSGSKNLNLIPGSACLPQPVEFRTDRWPTKTRRVSSCNSSPSGRAC
jgi:hypothetical protein